ncbi:hypothetical protein KKF34_05745 [Myxococcota bacterium]|nr:hypothetical protein [Myxococcota bacterium]MBU1380251.1 hypothetical protein [Myxococcota bacterium]MBU1496365.1 hypothetical protein [Myxococcota bacterium]
MNKLLISLATVIFLGSCSSDRTWVNISRAPIHIEPGDYFKVLKRWTRKKKVIRKFDTTLDLEATLLSWEFRWAHTVKYAADYRLTEDEKKALWLKQQTELDEFIDFVLIVASSDNDWNDLEKGTPLPASPGATAKGSHWRITLTVDEGKKYSPIKIQSVSPVTRIHKTMFPNIGHFHRLYIVRFKAKDGKNDILPSSTRKINLELSGPLGHAPLEWVTTNVQIQEN